MQTLHSIRESKTVWYTRRESNLLYYAAFAAHSKKNAAHEEGRPHPPSYVNFSALGLQRRAQLSPRLPLLVLSVLPKHEQQLLELRLEDVSREDREYEAVDDEGPDQRAGDKPDHLVPEGVVGEGLELEHLVQLGEHVPRQHREPDDEAAEREA